MPSLWLVSLSSCVDDGCKDSKNARQCKIIGPPLRYEKYEDNSFGRIGSAVRRLCARVGGCRHPGPRRRPVRACGASQACHRQHAQPPRHARQRARGHHLPAPCARAVEAEGAHQLFGLRHRHPWRVWRRSLRGQARGQAENNPELRRLIPRPVGGRGAQPGQAYGRRQRLRAEPQRLRQPLRCRRHTAVVEDIRGHARRRGTATCLWAASAKTC